MRLGDLRNNYQKVLGEDFDVIPKAVLAAIAVSFALRIREDNFAVVKEEILNEWRVLYEGGIVPQKPKVKK